MRPVAKVVCTTYDRLRTQWLAWKRCGLEELDAALVGGVVLVCMLVMRMLVMRMLLVLMDLVPVPLVLVCMLLVPMIMSVVGVRLKLVLHLRDVAR